MRRVLFIVSVATFWLRALEFEHLGSVEFSKMLMQEAGVAVSPGIGFGENGEGYVRMALVENEQRIRQAARNLKALLQSSKA